MPVHSGNKKGRSKNGGKKDDANAYWNRIEPSVYEHETDSGIEQQVRVFDDLDGETGQLHAQFSVKAERFRKNTTFKFADADEFGELVEFMRAVHGEVA